MAHLPARKQVCKPLGHGIARRAGRTRLVRGGRRQPEEVLEVEHALIVHRGGDVYADIAKVPGLICVANRRLLAIVVAKNVAEAVGVVAQPHTSRGFTEARRELAALVAVEVDGEAGLVL